MLKLILTCLLVSGIGNSFAADRVSTGYFNSIAIDGHDTVRYHDSYAVGQHNEKKGNKRYKVEWNNAEWLFASQESADRFKQNPEQYVPQYNGFCSNALSIDEGLIATDGTVWEFFGDNLHVFYAERGRQRWLKGDWKSYKADADAAWAVLRKK